MLKELVKKAKIPAKSRIVPQEVVVRYRDRIRGLAPVIKNILREEREEKEVSVRRTSGVYFLTDNIAETD